MNLTAQNTAIVVDSTADFPEAPERFPNWRIVPLYVNFGTESFKDGVDLTNQEFYERLRTSPVTPTTSQPTPADFLATYEELGGYERVLSLHISAKLSGTVQSAATAAGMAGGDRVRAIDTNTVSVAVSVLGLLIQERLERGTTDEEIDEFIERFKREHGLLFTVDTLEFLARGGRIGRAAKFAGTLMNVKPILSISDGEVVPLKRVRGNRKAFQEFVDALDTQTRDEPGVHVGMVSADAPERMTELWKMVRDRRPQAEVDIQSNLGAVVGTHVGPGTVGFFWFTDKE